MIVGEMIKEIRENAGLSQEQFAEKLAISRQAISKWERGKTLPDIENIMYISDIFNVSLDTIVKGDIKMSKKIISDSKNAKIINKLFMGLAVVAIAILVFILSSGGRLFPFFDPLAIIIIVTFPLLFSYIIYGKKSLIAFTAFSKRNHEREELEIAEDFFKNYSIILWMTVVLLLSIMFLLALIYLEKVEGLGDMLKFMGNVLLAAGFLNLTIVVPYKVKIKQNLIKIANE